MKLFFLVLAGTAIKALKQAADKLSACILISALTVYIAVPTNTENFENFVILVRTFSGSYAHALNDA